MRKTGEIVSLLIDSDSWTRFTSFQLNSVSVTIFFEINFVKYFVVKYFEFFSLFSGPLKKWKHDFREIPCFCEHGLATGMGGGGGGGGVFYLPSIKGSENAKSGVFDPQETAHNCDLETAPSGGCSFGPPELVVTERGPGDVSPGCSLGFV